VNVRFVTPARREFYAAVDFYYGQAAGLGADLIDEVERIIGLLRESPRIGSTFTDDTRRIPLRRFPFNLVYAVESDSVIVVALAHQRRKPGYWKDRG